MEFGLLQILFLLGVPQYLHSQYVLIQTNQTWDEAQAFCKENYLQLATLHDQSDLQNFRELMSFSNLTSKVWMGFSVDVNSWRWSHQNQNLTFTKWSSGEPNNAGGSEECGVLITFQDNIVWNDAPCFVHLNCVCYHEQTNRFIFVWDQTRTWHEAQLYCRQFYTDLAIIRTSADYDQIRDSIPDVQQVWMGLFRDSWLWLDGMAFSSTSVGRVHADNMERNEACGTADSQGQLEDATCSLLLPFVCSQGDRRQILRLEIKSSRSLENDTVILQHIQKKLLNHGTAGNIKITWKYQIDGLVFHKKTQGPERDPVSDQKTCQNVNF